ncbi:MAG TPA: hypothetical protein VEW47_14010 [Candidatus Dormibacteraeota bacterium]|nr:hypothetical protein [Candidatus Dormibacteraeota bacterium]
MRRFVNIAKSGRMAATRRVPPPAPKPLRKEAHRPRRGTTPSAAAARRRG